MSPLVFGAPGPTATTVASGRGEEVEVEGRKMPEAVFCARRVKKEKGEEGESTHGLWLEALDENAVEEGHDGADGLDGERLGGGSATSGRE